MCGGDAALDQVTLIRRYYRHHLITIIIFVSHTASVTWKDKNSSGDEIANVNFCTTTTYMERPAPTPIEPLLSTINIYGT